MTFSTGADGTVAAGAMACETGRAGFGEGAACAANATAEVAVTPRSVALTATTDISLRLEPFKVFPFRGLLRRLPELLTVRGADGGAGLWLSVGHLHSPGAGYAPRAAAGATAPTSGPSRKVLPGVTRMGLRAPDGYEPERGNDRCGRQ
ncbi:hypothetical protein LUX05_23370 [Streptomyces somaliensis]|nr:hypothetical protein [Streptomyces somaliensis]